MRLDEMREARAAGVILGWGLLQAAAALIEAIQKPTR
jgi:hypothetical protein